MLLSMRAAIEEIGSLDWGLRTDGLLTRSERRALRTRALRDGVVLARSRLLLAAGFRRGRGRADLSTLEAPDTPLAVATEQAARERQSPAVIGHALRTVAYAHAIASLDDVEVDAELLWCTALLHDIGLEHPERDRCFTVRGAVAARDIARQAHADPDTTELLGDAVCRHLTPALDPGRFPLPYLVATGALVDILGRRLEQLDRTFVDAVTAAEPRDGFARAIATVWKAEARSVPRGRAALADRLGFSCAARFAPRF
jgi:hypothetical protein